MNFTLVSRMGTWETKKRHAIAFPSSNFINTFCCAGQTVLIHAYKLQPPFLKICLLMNFVATSNGHKEHKKRNGNSKDKPAYVTRSDTHTSMNTRTQILFLRASSKTELANLRD